MRKLMFHQGPFKSEAQAYQAWRHDMKYWRNYYQRQQTILTWMKEHRDWHPQTKKMLESHGLRTNMPIRTDIDADIWSAQNRVGEYQELLNRYDVKHES